MDEQLLALAEQLESSLEMVSRCHAELLDHPDDSTLLAEMIRQRHEWHMQLTALLLLSADRQVFPPLAATGELVEVIEQETRLLGRLHTAFQQAGYVNSELLQRHALAWMGVLEENRRLLDYYLPED